MIYPRSVSRAFAALAFLALVFFAGVHCPADQDPPEKEPVIWGALIHGSPEKIPYGGEVPEEFPAAAESLKADFDHPHFSLVSENSHRLAREHESWVIPAKDLFLKIEIKGRTADRRGLELHLQIWHGKQILHKADAVLSPDSPLNIAGPNWEKGRLFAVLRLR